MRIWGFALLGVLVSLNKRADSFSCAPPEYRHTTPCEIPKCCESGQLTTEICSGCPTCAAAKDEECGAGFEAYQPDCAREFSCFTRCPACKTEPLEGPPESPEEPPSLLEGQECVFPFKYKGITYDKCTKVDSENDKSWCAYDITPGTEVIADGLHWGDCAEECPGADFECDSLQLFNMRGTCVPKMQQLIRIARPYKHEFRAGDNTTTSIQKCSELGTYVHTRIKEERCYCLPPRVGEEKQEGEGCTKEADPEYEYEYETEPLVVFAPEEIPPGAPPAPPPPPPPPRKRGWCFLGGVKDPRYYEPEEHCYDDLQWSETEQKYWSTDACNEVPEGGVPEK